MKKQLREMLQQAQRMQEEMQRVQAGLADERVEGRASGGSVRAVVNGHGDLLEISISPDAFDPGDLEMLEDMVVAAVRDATERSRELSREKLGQLGLPGMEGLL
ncbi:YbaB/EbfC family nucleoid-associated protein [Candidatus Fermentibacterales bacterium]|nr:YbaB/EbfC family nucleoid-associated protein [Candidatus Fermentibacterales bacterium]